MLTAHDVNSKTFEKSAVFGYKTDDVDRFMEQVALTIESLEEERAVLNKKLEVLAEKLEEYRSDEESLRAALLGAQKLGDSVIRESKNKAEIIMRDATVKAERMVEIARSQIEKEKLSLIKAQKDVAAFKNKLLANYKQHLELISMLPDDPDPNAFSQIEAQVDAELSERHAEPAPDARRVHVPDEIPQQPAEEPAAPQPVAVEEPVHQPELDPDTQEELFTNEMIVDETFQTDFDSVPVIKNINEGKPPKRESRFGPLKFGAGYDLKRND